MSYDDDTRPEMVVIDDLCDRWRALDVAIRAAIEQLDRHLAEFMILAERTSYAYRRIGKAVTGVERDDQWQAWCEMIGLDAVDALLCDLGARIQVA